MKKNKDLTPESVTLTIYGEAGEKFGAAWQTGDKGDPVLFVTEPDDRRFKRARMIPGETSPSLNTKIKNTAVIDGLKPDHDYLWKVGDRSGVYSAAAVMHTTKNDPDDCTFLVFTDTQDESHGGNWWNVTYREALREFPEGDFAVHAGDIVQMSGDPVQWAEMLGRTREYTRRIPMLPACGNHDYWRCYLHGNLDTFYEHFMLDLPPQKTTNGAYYSVDQGPFHFTVLSSGDCMDTNMTTYLPEQYEWAERDLMETDRPWKIVVVHNPMYSPGKYGSYAPIAGVCYATREQFGELFIRAGVDLVISGHDHVFSRTYPMRADAVPITDSPFVCENIAGDESEVYIDPKGPIHFIPGCAGEQNRSVEPNMTHELTQYFRDMMSMPPSAVAYAAVHASGDTMTVSFRMFNVESGESIFRQSFGVRKTSLSSNEK